MPADTVKLPGGAKVNRKVLYAAGAAGLGVVGYAWWTRQPAIPEDVVTQDELDAVGDERIPTTGVPYDPNFNAPPGALTTNSAWTTYATDRLVNLGFDAQAVSAALGKFIGRQALSAAEANIARAAIAQAGEPPEGRPWTVIEQSAPVGPTALAGFSAAPIDARSIRVSWTPPASGDVQVRIVNPPRGISSSWRKIAGSSWTAGGLGSGVTYRFEGRGVVAGNPGPTVTASAKTKTAGTSSGGTGGIVTHRIGKVGRSYSIRGQARRFALKYWNTAAGDAVEAMVRRLVNLNPALKGRTTIPGGFPLRVPTTR